MIWKRFKHNLVHFLGLWTFCIFLRIFSVNTWDRKVRKPIKICRKWWKNDTKSWFLEANRWKIFEKIIFLQKLTKRHPRRGGISLRTIRIPPTWFSHYFQKPLKMMKLWKVFLVSPRGVKPATFWKVDFRKRKNRFFKKIFKNLVRISIECHLAPRNISWCENPKS